MKWKTFQMKRTCEPNTTESEEYRSLKINNDRGNKETQTKNQKFTELLCAIQNE